MRTNFSQEVQPIILTEPQIQNDHTGMRLLKMAVQLVSAGCRLGRDIVLLQIAGHHLSQRGVILNNNDMRIQARAIRKAGELLQNISSAQGMRTDRLQEGDRPKSPRNEA